MAKSHEKAAEQAQASRQRVAQDWNTPPRGEVHGTVDGLTGAGKEKDAPLELHAVDGRVYLDSHGEIVLDQDGVIRLRKELDAAFQAVS